MHIALLPEYEAYIKEQVSSGHYASAEDLIADALKALMSGDADAAFDSRLADSRAAYKRGEYSVADDAFFETKLDAIKEKHGLE